MYANYFGFNTLPFTNTLDPRFLYDTPACREAMANLCYGIQGRRGFILITGAPGTGKTTLLHHYVQKADVKIRKALISAGQLTVSQMPRVLLNELGVAPASEDRAGMTRQLKDYLIEQAKRNHIVALLVDDAQELSNELLEELRLLSNLETAENKLIQIVLAGQPDLEERVDQPALRQLKQRIALRCRLVPFRGEDVSYYIQTRLHAAGSNEQTLFEAKAVEKVALYSDGIPRLINMVCDSALLYCYGRSKKIVSADMVDEAARDLQLSRPTSSEKLNPTQQDWPKDNGWIIAEPEAVSPVSQRPLADQIHDVFMSAEPRRKGIHWHLTPATLATRLVFALFAAAGLGGYFYAKANQIYPADIPARILEGAHLSANLNHGAVESEALHHAQPAELKDVQPMVPEKPALSAQQEAGVGADAAAITEPSALAVADPPDETLEKKTVKTAEKNENTIKTATKGSSNKPARDRLEFDIHRAIARHMIRGVEVSVVDGTVFLGGRVDTKNQKIAAARAASNVPGVKYVRDNITVTQDVAS